MSTTTNIRALGPEPKGFIEKLGLPRPLIWGFVGLLLFMIGDGVESGYISPYLAENGAGGETNAAIIISVYGLMVTLGSWLSGALSDVWGPRRVMLIGLALWGVLQVLFLAVALPSENFTLMLIIYGLRGIAYPLFAYGFLVWVLGASPAHRLGSAVGWFYFAFTGGLPTLGSLVASGTEPLIGPYMTFWVSLALVIAGGIVSLVGLRGASGGGRQAAPEVTTGRSLINSVAIAFTNPRVGLGCLIRVVNTAPQFGLFVFFPTVFAVDLGFGTAGWLQLVFILGAANIFANLFFGVLSDRLGWHRTLRWFGCIGSAVSVLLFYFLPQAVGDQYWVAALCAALFGVTLAGFTPISVLMSLMAPGQKGNSIAVLNLGAGAATFVGPLIVAVFLAPLGAAGVTIIFAALYVLAGISVRWLKVPKESEEIIEEGGTLQSLTEQDSPATRS
ncbi:polyol permease family [Pseudoclavibacter sp. JAI123]|uniref:MFS transporter n=1 Tax=Pseudoclavibacter sp. JAI123 TaxID=2723065 RepID=UPI0015CA936C|nr:MFS transporter [Pseudoclavibacter sp. JAI123]NYF14254.1 polyol permease family [Pseudoclavibacter sp. JAI123]